MKNINNKSWYAILVTLMIIGFLIVLTTGVLNLLLNELNDNKWEEKYLKASFAAEWAMELALLKIKNEWYWIYDKIEFENFNSDILRDDINNKKEVSISYDLNSKTDDYKWILLPYEQVVVPLFYMSWTPIVYNKVKKINLSIINYSEFSVSDKMAWNIISENGDWIWWKSLINQTSKWKWRMWDWGFLSQVNINWNSGFLDLYNKNYMVIINLDPNNNLEYNLKSIDWEFTRPISKIISSAKIWKYKQTYETFLDNTEFLSILKYSVFSN